MNRTKKSSNRLKPKQRISYSNLSPKREHARQSTGRAQSNRIQNESKELEGLFGRAVLAIVWKHDPLLYKRINSWVNDLKVAFEKTMRLWDRETALNELKKMLADPVLPDHRKNKNLLDDDS